MSIVHHTTTYTMDDWGMCIGTETTKNADGRYRRAYFWNFHTTRTCRCAQTFREVKMAGRR